MTMKFVPLPRPGNGHGNEAKGCAEWTVKQGTATIFRRRRNVEQIDLRMLSTFMEWWLAERIFFKGRANSLVQRADKSRPTSSF